MTRRARPSSQGAVLAEALARARAGAPRGVAVFDLDSTLLDNRPRQARILQDYGRAAGLPELLRARPEHWTSWDLPTALANAGLDDRQIRRHLHRARRFWARRFFTSAYCRLDLPVPGAPEFVRAIAAAGARIAYVTGRPAHMAEGTRDVLARFGFVPPDAVHAFLVMKPDQALGDDEWKARARAVVERIGPAVVAFDNEPAHVNAYARAWPGALAVHLDTGDSGRPVEVLPAIPSIADFRLPFPAEAARDAAGAG